MLGNILIVLAFLAGLYSMVQFYRSYKIGKVLKSARVAYHAMTILIISASAFLLYAITTHQYQYKYVFEYSNADLSNGMLMSTFFAGQEGSFLLWLLFTSLIGLFFLERKDYSAKKEASFMGVYTLAVSFLLLMVTPLLKSPFEYIWSIEHYVDIKYFSQSILSLPALKDYIFSNQNSDGNFVQLSEGLLYILKSNGILFEEFLIKGKGLNPLLQNFWMQIHPPILFLGYALVTIPYSFAISATIRNEYKDWVGEAKYWVIISLVILGLGIMIGGYWAYGVLGWGGYWAWDPVENASLIPWIVLAALLHTLIIQKQAWQMDKQNRFVKTNLILAALSYVFVIYSTFLTRSGILSDASVHSFSDPGEIVYLFLIIYILTFILLGFGSVFFRRNDIEVHKSDDENLFTREYGLFYGAFALIASTIVVLVGTSSPIFGQSVELDFYNKMNLPLVIIMNLLIGITLFLKWKSTDKNNFIREILPSTVVSIVITILFAFIFNTTGIIILIFAFTAFFVLVVNIQFLFNALKTNWLLTGGHITHAGFAIFILGVLITGFFSESAKIDLYKGESLSQFGKNFTFVGYNGIENGSKFAFNVKVKDDGKESIVTPVMYRSDYNGSLMRNPDILVGFDEDIYISPLGFDSGKSENNSNTIVLNKKESKTINGVEVVFDGFEFPEEIMEKMTEGADFEIGAKLQLTKNKKEYSIVPRVIFSDGEKEYGSITIDDENLLVSLISLDVAGNVTISIESLDKVAEPKELKKDVLSVEISIKPYISFVWLGVIVMSIGLIISSIRRRKEIITK
ncbi:MAG: cytochrome c biogenesis protein CcsA [Melioribacteraceae bacterium]|nr:cytochrome c biogenesis protein CcsA [Melioribacteraceae bacterium]